MNHDYCLWMGDIDPRMDESLIRNLFQLHNVYPLDIKLIKNKKANKNKNYCFIYFQNIFEANRTLNQLNGKSISNSPFKFKLNWGNYLTSTNKKIYVGNLNPLVNDITLFNFFKSKYKSVLKAKVKIENGQSKKYGFVSFKKGNDYRKSLIEMDGFFFEGTNIKVREYKKNDVEENNKNNQQILKDKKINQLGINNAINNINNNISNTNDLNSSSFLSISNSINKLNWINDATPINDVIIGINNNDTNINSKNNWFNQSISRNNYNKKNNIINLNYNINSDMEYNNLIVDDINNNIINNNKTNKGKVNKFPKLEILEEIDEITLKMKINENLNKMLEYYKESVLINGNNVESKLILNLIFL